jgi:protein-L-isoaspartate(D-aspartate) O-methyltransferase
MLDTAKLRAAMVERQLERRGIRDRHVLDAMRQVPREAFVPVGLVEFAYEDAPLPIEVGQTISQPYIVGLMIEAASVRPGERVLEVGAGSGYAAAVLSRIAAAVFTIDRHGELAAGAAQRLASLGYDNVKVRTGDGTLGWPEAAPFDAILVAAGGPRVPEALTEQLAEGGRLVMPLEEEPGRQNLIRLTRGAGGELVRDDLGAVMFVPLIGVQGWAEQTPATPAQAQPLEAPPPQARRDLPALIREAAVALPEIGSPAFSRHFDGMAAHARVVLLGEASHGTSEFYRARHAITQRLIEHHGFSIVAVEADWPDAASIDRLVRQRPALHAAEPPFQRFPTWMWRNTEMAAFVEWLSAWNAARAPQQRAAFYGLDLYNLSASIRAVLDYLDRVDPEAAQVARQRYGCLTPWSRDPAAYGRMALGSGYAACEEAVVRMLADLQARELSYTAKDGEAFLDAAANARLVKNAEAYYRAMYYGGAESWNLRDTHMFDTLEAILRARGTGAKAVVWAHNSHIGDAAHTEMGLVRDEINLGQLCRERFGREAVLIGFGTHAGEVACASDWDGPMEVKSVVPSRAGSYERLSHDAGLPCFLLDLRGGAVREPLLAARLERFIGVIYRPESERWSHYAECSLPQQFDAWLWFDETTPVTPAERNLWRGGA